VFQLSGGDVSGLWSEPLAVVVYVIIALVLVWPLALKLWRRAHPAPAAAVAAPVVAAAAVAAPVVPPPVEDGGRPLTPTGPRATSREQQ
jgi:putative tricarboxylic transport membrane protein